MFPDDFTQASAIFRTMSGLCQRIMQPEVRNLSGNKLNATLPRCFLRVNEFSVRPFRLPQQRAIFPGVGTRCWQTDAVAARGYLDTRVQDIRQRGCPTRYRFELLTYVVAYSNPASAAANG